MDMPQRAAARRLRASVAVGAFAFALTLTQTHAQSGPWPSQPPYYPYFPTRRTTVLTGTWSFGYFPTSVLDPASAPYSALSTPNTTSVPGAFDVAPPGILGPRGVAIYRSTHTCTPGAPALLRFGAVNFYARVFVDGSEIGNHTAGGYTPFSMVAPACAAGGSREVTVVCANTQNGTLSPTFTGGDFYFYSGIIRPVIVTELPTQYGYWLAGVEPINKDYVRGIVDVRVRFSGNMSGSPTVHMSYSVNGGAYSTSAQYPVVDGVAIIPNVQITNYKPWTLGQGNLYTLTVLETALNDSITIRSGVRVLGIDPTTSRVTINGEIVKLVGFNRHTMWPDTGAAVTQEQEAADLALLKGVNANYVRGAHYPQSQSWLDRLDEAGIVLWEEALGPGTSTRNMNDPYFMSNHLAAVQSMVLTSFHHPSVIYHAFFNEGPSNDPMACTGYIQSTQLIKSLVADPPMRFVTWASNKGSSDVCIAGYADVASFNSYPGWYDHCCNVTYPTVYWPSQSQWVEQNWPSTPFMVSETGGGGVYEWTNDTAPFPGPQWSQQYQKWLVTADASTLANDTRVTGFTLWQFSDIKANDQSTQQCGQCDYLPHPNNLSVPWTCAYIDVTCGRPGGENHKGTVDFWRRVKEEYAPLSAIFANASSYDTLTQRF